MQDERQSDYCAVQVRTYDRDRYLSALFAPADRRDALFALYAFNLEIAKTREIVSEPLLGQMRLQWWRDAIQGLYAGDVRRHQVVEALAAAVARYGLSPDLFARLIDAREFDLGDAPPVDGSALERYAEESAAPLNALGLEILGVADGTALRASRHGAMAIALTGMVRAIPFHARDGRCLLPEDLLRREGLSRDRITAGRSREGLARIAAEMAALARPHIREARDLRARLPRKALPVMLPVALAAADLRKLERTSFDVFHPRNRNNLLGRQLRLSAAALLGRY